MTDATDAPDLPLARPVPMTRTWPLWLTLALLGAAMVLTVTPSLNNFVRFVIMMLAPGIALLLGLAWLVLLSRLRGVERLVIAGGGLALGGAIVPFVHESMWTPMWIYGGPLALLAMATGAGLTRRAGTAARLGATLALIAAAWGVFCLGRLDGVDGSYLPDFAWRWSPTLDAQFAAGTRPVATEAAVAGLATLNPSDLDWPAFRGPDRNGRVRGAGLATDWNATPPIERWRVPIGAGWSSFAHVSGRLFTLEQRGAQEAVVCLDAATGGEIWHHVDEERFNEVMSGAGPRGTPTFADGRLYALGATSRLTCLDAHDGTLRWQRDLAAELGAPLPMWGFSSSPFVVNGLVIVYAGGRDGHGLVAYDTDTGAPAWHVESTGENYGSAQPATIAETDLALFTDSTGLLALDPVSGAVLWRHAPAGWRGQPIVQPQWIGGNDILLPLGDGIGMSRIEVDRIDGTWTVAERWATKRLKPSFNDFVHHDGAIYGFDQSTLTCIDAATGARQWRGRGYGFGQLVLLAESDALVVTTESGDIVLVDASPDAHRELGRIAALEGKTWNHPVVVDGRVFARNGVEAVCYDLPREGSP